MDADVELRQEIDGLVDGAFKAATDILKSIGETALELLQMLFKKKDDQERNPENEALKKEIEKLDNQLKEYGVDLKGITEQLKELGFDDLGRLVDEYLGLENGEIDFDAQEMNDGSVLGGGKAIEGEEINFDTQEMSDRTLIWPGHGIVGPELEGQQINNNDRTAIWEGHGVVGPNLGEGGATQTMDEGRER